MQEFSNSIKRPNLRIVDIEEEGEDVQPKGIHNIFNKITEKFSNLQKVLPIQVQKSSRTSNRFDQNRTSQGQIIIKTTSTENRKRILKSGREEKQIMYKSKSSKIAVDFLMETLKARRAWSKVF
jgi:hypothetical protein